MSDTFTPRAYRPADHFWIVASNPTQVFSSALARYVNVTNAGYSAWLALGNVPTPIATEDELWDVLADAAPQGIPTDNVTGQDRLKARLIAMLGVPFARILYNADQRLRVLEGKPAITFQQFVTGLKALL